MKRTMTEYQRELVVEHLDLIDWVIRRRIQVRGMILLSYEDYYSVGCEALCHAAMHYRPENGEFAPFACTVLYHAMIDHCRKQNQRANLTSDLPTDRDNEAISLDFLSTVNEDLEDAIDRKRVMGVLADCKRRYGGVAGKGIEVLELKSLGYTSRELADHYGTTINNLNAWIARARAKLRCDPAFLAVLS